jgi:hypothetical protein
MEKYLKKVPTVNAAEIPKERKKVLKTNPSLKTIHQY